MKFDNLQDYTKENIHIGCIGSHSALEIAYGAKEAGLKTVVVVQKGREKTYTHYYKNLFDEIIIVDQFKDIATPKVVEQLQSLHTIFVPNRSFSVYVGYDEIETHFKVPLFGNRNLLRAEERTEEHDQFWYLEQAEIPSNMVLLWQCYYVLVQFFYGFSFVRIAILNIGIIKTLKRTGFVPFFIHINIITLYSNNI